MPIEVRLTQMTNDGILKIGFNQPLRKLWKKKLNEDLIQVVAIKQREDALEAGDLGEKINDFHQITSLDENGIEL